MRHQSTCVYEANHSSYLSGRYRKTLAVVRIDEQLNNLVRKIDKMYIYFYISLRLCVCMCIYAINYKVRAVRHFSGLQTLAN